MSQRSSLAFQGELIKQQRTVKHVGGEITITFPLWGDDMEQEAPTMGCP